MDNINDNMVEFTFFENIEMMRIWNNFIYSFLNFSASREDRVIQIRHELEKYNATLDDNYGIKNEYSRVKFKSGGDFLIFKMRFM